MAHDFFHICIIAQKKPAFLPALCKIQAGLCHGYQELSFIMKKTNAARLLDKLKIAYEIKEYPVDETDLSAANVAQKVGLHLRLFPVETLKIDKSFIDNVPGREAVLVHSLVKFAQNLNMKVVAEGVESSEQWEFLQNCDCDMVQGYFVSRPLPEAEAMKFLKMKNG